MSFRQHDTPVVQTRVAELRDVNTRPARFRALVHELATVVLAQVANDLHTSPRDVVTPLETTVGSSIDEPLALVPIIRAGEGMLPAALMLFPEALVWHLGIERVEKGGTVHPRQYLDKTQDVRGRGHPPTAIVLDPMLATAGSANHACMILKERGVPRIIFVSLIAAPEGVEAFRAHHDDVELHVAALDRQLNDKKYILPGLGDAGDRLYPTVFPT